MTRRLGVLVAVLALAATASADKPKPKTPPAAKKPAKADPAPAPADDQADGSAADGSAADDEANIPPHVTGPKLVDLGHDCQVDLPAGDILLEHDEAQKIIQKGGGDGGNVLAMIIPISDETQSWELRIDYDDVGYVTDSDADKLDANELFNQYKQGTDEDNVRRRSMGLSELFLDGWSEMPKYDKATRKLVWGFKAHTLKGPNINYFTRLLGRNGYMSVDLIDDPDKIDAAKQQAAGVLASTTFKAGATYADHKSGDKDSGMGLKALIVGGAGVVAFGAAKSGGLIALLLALKKGIIVIVLGIGAFFKKLFGRGKKVELPPDGPPPSDSPPVG